MDVPYVEVSGRAAKYVVLLMLLLTSPPCLLVSELLVHLSTRSNIVINIMHTRKNHAGITVLPIPSPLNPMERFSYCSFRYM
jgi:hypothetical protein